MGAKEFHLIDGECPRCTYEFLKCNAFPISKCPGLTFHFDGKCGAIRVSDTENGDTLKVRSVITTGSDSTVFDLIRDIGCRETNPFSERAAAFQIVGRNVCQPRTHRVRGENRSGNILGKKGDRKNNNQAGRNNVSLEKLPS